MFHVEHFTQLLIAKCKIPNNVIPAVSLSGNPDAVPAGARFHGKHWIPAKNMQE